MARPPAPALHDQVLQMVVKFAPLCQPRLELMTRLLKQTASKAEARAEVGEVAGLVAAARGDR